MGRNLWGAASLSGAPWRGLRGGLRGACTASVRLAYPARVTTPQPCPECGARPRGSDVTFCSYCGTRLIVERSAGEMRRDDRQARLGRVRGDLAYADAMLHSPSLTTHLAGGMMGVGCMVGFAAVAGLMALGASGLSLFGFRQFGAAGAPGLIFVLVPLLMCGIGIMGAITAARRTRMLSMGVFERLPALVRDERSESGEKSTSHFVTLEFEDGARTEYQVDGRTSGSVAPDDVGVAYIKGGFLIDFRRFDV